MSPLVRADAPPAQLLVRGARVLDPRGDLDGVRDVLVRDGRVAEIGDAITAPADVETIDGTGRLLAPAFVDPHVHLRVPGQEHKEDLDTGTRAAAAGGYSAIVAMANTSPVVDDPAVLGALLERAGREARVKLGFCAAVTVGLEGRQLTEQVALAELGAVAFTDDGVPIRDAGVMRRALRYGRLHGKVLMLHEEDPALSGHGAMNEGVVSAALGVEGIPTVSESTMIARDWRLARHESARIHVQHVTCRDAVEAVAEGIAAGAPITGEASPHHLVLTDEDVRGLDTRMKMNPPLRTADDRAAVIEGVRNGTLCCIATDHAPHSREEKDVPFEEAPMGTTGLECAFAVLHTELVRPGLLTLETVLLRMTEGAAICDLPVPRIEPGAEADLVLLDLDETWTVGESGYVSKSDNCCFDGRQVSGAVKLTVAGGAVAHREGVPA